jgi:NAD(P)-dependent dehydrogenase (short-subunit alcohol dehydrogenase family)
MTMATGRLTGRAAIITGANQGLGLEIACAYVREGASVAICARDAAKLDAARALLEQEAGEGQRIVAEVADVSVPADVTRVVQAAIGAFGRVHVLVNNAGVYGPFGRIEDVDWAEWTRAMAINIEGSVLPCRALLPHFREHRYGKIVQLSGGGATSPLPRISAYAASKAAIVRFAETLAVELEADGIDVNAIAPGALDTRLLDQLLDAGPEQVGAAFYEKMRAVKAQGGTPLDRGAALAVFLGSAASDGVTGRLLSAVWDPWDRLPALAAELATTDIYTLRRIVPGDRGKDWDKP